MATAHVHRFHEFAAVGLPGSGETVYFTPSDARRLADALTACANNIESQPQFSTSNFRTVEFELSNKGSRHGR